MRRSQTETHYDFQPDAAAAQPLQLHKKRLGIYAGVFDPVHAGHLKFALEAQKQVKLDHIYFVAERKPGRGAEPEHYVHRSAMLTQALRPYMLFSLFDLPDARLTARSLKRIDTTGTEVFLLTTASQLLWSGSSLPAVYRMYPLVVAVINNAQMAEVLERLSADGQSLGNITFVSIGTDHISSAMVRHGLRKRKPVRGLLPSVWRYARKQWLYLPPIHRT